MSRVQRYQLFSVAAVLFPFSATLRSQTPPANPTRTPKIEFAVSTDFVATSVVAQLTRALSTTGWDGTSPGMYDPFFGTSSDPTTHPVSHGDRGTATSFSAIVTLRPWMQIGALVSGKMTTGWVAGFREIPATGSWDGYRVTMYPSFTSASILAFLRLPPLRVGLGPAYYRATIDFPNGDLGRHTEAQSRSYSRLGAVTDVALVTGGTSHFYLEARWQYRWMRDMTIGPYDIGAYSHEYGTSRFEATKVSFRHSAIALGAGVRF